MGKEEDERRTRPPIVAGTPVRRTDIEPYTALKWVSSLFKGAAVFLAVAVIAEFIAGIRMEGPQALSILLGELARTAVLAVVLWGGGDLVRLLMHVGHDVRAQRIMLARVAFRLRKDAVAQGPIPPEEIPPGAETGDIEAAD
jgi:hypothetical protein